MTTLAVPPLAPPGDRLRRITVDEYLRMIEVGIIREDERVELLEGLLVVNMTPNPPHATALGKLEDELGARLPRGWVRRSQLPIILVGSAPEPDVVLAQGTRATFSARHPGPADIGLVVEISDASLAEDQGRKLRIYADAGISLYWIVNIPDRRVEVYTQPTGTGATATYGHVQHCSPADALTLVLGGTALAPILVSDILP